MHIPSVIFANLLVFQKIEKVFDEIMTMLNYDYSYARFFKLAHFCIQSVLGTISYARKINFLEILVSLKFGVNDT